jgi:Rieske Fe-S protein
MSCQDCLNRREFLAKSAAAAAALVAVEACGDGQIGPTAAVEISGVNTVKLADFPGLATVGTVVEIGAQRALVRTSASPAAFQAFSRLCTHEQCITDVRNNQFECPCHGSIFSNTGAVVRGPDVANNGITPLRALTVTFDAVKGEITIS